MGYHLAGYAASGAVPGRHGTAFPSIAPYETFAAADGQLMLAVGNDRAFASFCGVVGLEHLADDPLYATNGERVRNRAALRALVAERLAGDTRERWLERFAAANVPAAPVQDAAEVSPTRRPRASSSRSTACRSRASRLRSTASARSTSRRRRRSVAILTRCSSKPDTPPPRSPSCARAGVIG